MIYLLPLLQLMSSMTATDAMFGLFGHNPFAHLSTKAHTHRHSDGKDGIIITGFTEPGMEEYNGFYPNNCAGVCHFRARATFGTDEKALTQNPSGGFSWKKNGVNTFVGCTEATLGECEEFNFLCFVDGKWDMCQDDGVSIRFADKSDWDSGIVLAGFAGLGYDDGVVDPVHHIPYFDGVNDFYPLNSDTGNYGPGVRFGSMVQWAVSRMGGWSISGDRIRAGFGNEGPDQTEFLCYAREIIDCVGGTLEPWKIHVPSNGNSLLYLHKLAVSAGYTEHPWPYTVQDIMQQEYFLGVQITGSEQTGVDDYYPLNKKEQNYGPGTAYGGIIRWGENNNGAHGWVLEFPESKGGQLTLFCGKKYIESCSCNSADGRWSSDNWRQLQSGRTDCMEATYYTQGVTVNDCDETGLTDAVLAQRLAKKGGAGQQTFCEEIPEFSNKHFHFEKWDRALGFKTGVQYRGYTYEPSSKTMSEVRIFYANHKWRMSHTQSHGDDIWELSCDESIDIFYCTKWTNVDYEGHAYLKVARGNKVKR